ncbi:cell division cycle protein 123 homolog [Lolium rigidum]|uniref:cell division cycle protein 123 homolog n=1 Tax=Lolium rigidum TaxID=89674 RepID=UPI001F5C356D|nr:cell division cycle protein 123 homolog [Lolium rigidum]
MLLEELLRCQIQEWYPTFRRHTVPTVIIPLPAAFLRYLAGKTAYPDPDASDQDEDGPLPFLLPTITSGRTPFPPIRAHLPDPVSLLDHDASELIFDSCSSSSDNEDEDNLLRPAFPELEAAVDAAIAELGGAALPKLNWSAPKDAVFMAADATTRCTCFAEVAMLLRASDCIAHDLVSARASCQDFVRPEGVRRNAGEADSDASEEDDSWLHDGFQYYLALRKWYPGLRPESEFRCFVRGRKLVGVSQRDPSAYYPSLPGWRAEVQPKIEDFFEDVIEPQFASENYTFDVSVRADGRVKLIDFNPWGGYTLPLMFEWEELEEEQRGDEELEFRVVMQQGAVRPGLMTAVPYDMLDWGDGSGWDVFLKKADSELNRQMASLDVDS